MTLDYASAHIHGIHVADHLQLPSDVLLEDIPLRNSYMRALTKVLKDPEISDGFDYVNVKPIHIRMDMLRDAEQIFYAAPLEYHNYLVARDGIKDALDEAISLLSVEIFHGQITRRFNIATRILTSTGGAAMLFSAFTEIGDAFAIGLSMAIASGLTLFITWASSRSFALPWLDRFHRLIEPLGHLSVSAIVARRALMATLEADELVAQMRQRINARRKNRFDHRFLVVGRPELSATFDSAYHVPTEAASDLDDLLDRLSSGSIGIAGPRGSGKSTLIRRYCQNLAEKGPDRNLRCLVSAPVEYAPHDFVLHLFVSFCRQSLRYLAPSSKRRFPFRLLSKAVLYIMLAGAVVQWPKQALEMLTILDDLLAPLLGWLVTPLSALLSATAIDQVLATPQVATLFTSLIITMMGLIHVSIATFRHYKRQRRRPAVRLAAKARKHLTQARYLQTITSGVGGAIKLPVWVEGQASHGRTKVEQPVSYPEIVAAFRDYVQEVATHLKPNYSVYIGVDELDKIGSTEEAERFLNEIKGIFCLPNTYFIISVSDDAMNAFERRGLPFRDAFDSSFDEIIRVGLLTYDESIRVLSRRVVGLTEPYIAFCHCLSGGLSRDLIRVARSVIHTGRSLNYELAQLTTICAIVIQEEICHKARAIVESIREYPVPLKVLHLMYNLAYRRPAATTYEVLKSMLNHSLEGPSLEFATYVYFCATLEEVFTYELTVERVRNSRIFDHLATARHTFTIETELAWLSISTIRESLGLNVWQLPPSVVRN